VALVLVLGVGVYGIGPYFRSALLVVRAADLGGRVEAFADREARPIAVHDATSIPTRQGTVPTQFYEPRGGFTRTVLLIPGIHAAGINEARLTHLARDLAGSGVAVMTLALPDLMHYQITPQSTDVIEDAIAYFSRLRDFAPDGRIGIVGVSFSGGLSIVAAGRPSVRSHVAFVVSFGGHGDLRRVMRYLCTGEEPAVEGVQVHPPHDYGVAVMLYGAAHAVVPPDQVELLRTGVGTFLTASQEALVDTAQADATFQRARTIAQHLPEPSATDMTYVNTRDTKALGAILLPHLSALGIDNPALSPEHAPLLPTAPVFLLHGAEDTVIPASEAVLLSRYLGKTTHVRLLLSKLITHAEANSNATPTETWKLVSFWAEVLRN
jgi:dienelactone hydrolase